MSADRVSLPPSEGRVELPRTNRADGARARHASGAAAAGARGAVERDGALRGAHAAGGDAAGDPHGQRDGGGAREGRPLRRRPAGGAGAAPMSESTTRRGRVCAGRTATSETARHGVGDDSARAHGLLDLCVRLSCGLFTTSQSGAPLDRASVIPQGHASSATFNLSRPMDFLYACLASSTLCACVVAASTYANVPDMLVCRHATEWVQTPTTGQR